MSSNWHVRYSFPITLPGEPVKPLDPRFQQFFVRTKIYDKVDGYIFNIKMQHGKFWVSSEYGGCGKSTMLSYIARQLYLKIASLRALPFFFSIPQKFGRTVQHTFIKNFLEQFATVDVNLRKASEVLGISGENDIEKIMQGFADHKEGIQELKDSLGDLNEEELRRKFLKVLERVLLPWKEKGVFEKYVMLIDEMDKLPPEDVLRFLAGSQKLFEQVYDEYGFVAFLAGHSSWVERIRSGTEFSYYQGEIFRVPPFLEAKDVSTLVESRLVQYVHMIPSDNPWTEDGYRKIQELTGGVPRKILNLAASVMNEAFRKRSRKIGSGLVEEVLVREDYLREITTYLQVHYETYTKLKESMKKRLDSILYTLYDMPHHRILKIYDRDIALRTTVLALELSNEEWLESINLLAQIGCVEDRGTTWELSDDITTLFDKLSEHPAMIQKLVPTTIRNIGDIKPKVLDVPPPQYNEIIERIFRLSPKEWLSEEQIYEKFSYAARVRSYVNIKYPRNPESAVKKIFKNSFNEYFTTKSESLLIVFKDDKKLFRRFPSKMKKIDREILRLESPSLIDMFIDAVVEPEFHDPTSVEKIDKLIEHALRIIGDIKGEKIEDGILRKKKRYGLFQKLDFSREVRNHFDFYLRETKHLVPTSGIVQELVRQILLDLTEMFISVKPPLEVTSEEDYASLRELENGLRQYFENELSVVSSRWWKERIPPEVQERAEDRKRDEEARPWPWYGKKDESLICYLSFSDYAEIAKRRDNWRDCFKKAFMSRTQLLASLERLEPVRNAVAHNRALTSHQKMTLSVEKDYLLNSMKHSG
jgi:hypothetical protein